MSLSIEHLSIVYVDKNGHVSDDAPVIRCAREYLLEIEAGDKLDLKLLEGVTIAEHLDAALAAFDPGDVENGRSLTRTDGSSKGFGMTVVCVRNGEPRCHIFLCAQTLSPLMGTHSSQQEVSKYLLAHEACHAHDLACRVGAFAMQVAKPPADALSPLVFWTLFEVAWNEYAASRLSAHHCPSMKNQMETMLLDTVIPFKDRLRHMIAECKRVGTSAPSFGLALDAIYSVLKHSAYLQGHLDAIGIDEISPGLKSELAQAGLLPWFERLHEVLRGMWKDYPAWKSLDVYGPLRSSLIEGLACCFLQVYENNGELKSKLHIDRLATLFEPDPIL